MQVVQAGIASFERNAASCCRCMENPQVVGRQRMRQSKLAGNGEGQSDGRFQYTIGILSMHS